MKPARALTLLAIVVAVHAGTLAMRRAAHVPPPIRALSDVEGSIAAAVLHYRADAGFVEPTYEALLRAFDPAIDVVVVVTDARDRAAFEAIRLRAGFGPVRYVETGYGITPWSRDRFTAAADAEGRAAIVAPPRPHEGPAERLNEVRVPWSVARAFDARIKVAPFDFDGGDFIVCGRFVFVGSQVVDKNVPARYPDAAALLRAVGDALGREPVLVTSEAGVPDHHLEMYVTPLDERRVLVGRAEGGDLAARLDGVAVDLERKGFDVLRIALEAVAPRRYVSYNNVVLETRGGRARVFLPTYGRPSDAGASAAWAGLGFDVVPIPVDRVWPNTGSLHCLVNVARRGV